MGENDSAEDDRGEVIEDTLRSIARGYHLQKYGHELIIAAHDRQFLLNSITSDSEYMKLFALSHLLSWAFDDDAVFVEFSKECLTSESSLDLKSAAVMYLTQSFYSTGNYELLLFLRGVLWDLVGSLKSQSAPPSEVARKLSGFVYFSIMQCLDRRPEISNLLSPALLLNERVLDEVDRALDARIDEDG